MTARDDNSAAGSVERLHSQPRQNVVTDELNRIMALVKAACPADAKISFQFDGKLRLFIDVRTLEQVMVLEAMLPTVGAGMFREIQRAAAPHHSFQHRLTALVDR